MLEKGESPLLWRPMEQVARPTMVGCLWCGGWVGGQPQGSFFKVWSGSAHVQLNRVGVSTPSCASFLGFLPCSLVQFFEGLMLCSEYAYSVSILPRAALGSACRPCGPRRPVSPVRPWGPLGPHKSPQWDSAIPPGPSEPRGQMTLSVFLSTFMWIEIWAEFPGWKREALEKLDQEQRKQAGFRSTFPVAHSESIPPSVRQFR